MTSILSSSMRQRSTGRSGSSDQSTATASSSSSSQRIISAITEHFLNEGATSVVPFARFLATSSPPPPPPPPPPPAIDDEEEILYYHTPSSMSSNRRRMTRIQRQDSDMGDHSSIDDYDFDEEEQFPLSDDPHYSFESELNGDRVNVVFENDDDDDGIPLLERTASEESNVSELSFLSSATRPSSETATPPSSASSASSLYSWIVTIEKALLRPPLLLALYLLDLDQCEVIDVDDEVEEENVHQLYGSNPTTYDSGELNVNVLGGDYSSSSSSSSTVFVVPSVTGTSVDSTYYTSEPQSRTRRQPSSDDNVSLFSRLSGATSESSPAAVAALQLWVVDLVESVSCWL